MHGSHMYCITSLLVLLVEIDSFTAHEHFHHSCASSENCQMKQVSPIVVYLEIQTGLHAAKVNEQWVVFLVNSLEEFEL